MISNTRDFRTKKFYPKQKRFPGVHLPLTTNFPKTKNLQFIPVENEIDNFTIAET